MRILRYLPLLCLSLLPTFGTTAAPADPSSLSPSDAQRAIDVLQDRERRQDVMVALKALADPNAPAKAVESAEAAPPAEAAPVEAAPEEPAAIVPLEEGGLIARTIQQIGDWGDGLGRQMKQLQRAARDLPDWWRASFDNDEGRERLTLVLMGLALVFAAGLAVEWSLRWLLSFPKRRLIRHAEEADIIARQAPLEATPPEPASPQAGGTRPPADNVALVQVQRDGKEELEAIPIAPQQAAGPAPEPVPEAVPPEPHYEHETRRRVSAIHRLPYATAALLLDLLPLALFFAAAAMTLRSYADGNAVVGPVLENFVNAYVTTRVTMAIVRLLVSPRGHSLQMIPVSQRVGEILERWTRRFVATATFGMALAEAVEILGEGSENRILVLKCISLLVHVFAVILIFQLRKPVADMIRAKEDARGAWAGARNWLSKIWVVFASAAVLGAWLVWAMGVEDGFPKLLNFLAISGAILVAGHLASVVIHGALGRLFHSEPGTEEPTASLSLHHYYPVARGVTTLAIAVGTAVALFQAWGFNAIGWFAQGTIGRSLMSAATTILIAATSAVLVWQWANLVVNRRLRRWTQQGDLLRAARLRTLLPMLRTGLFIIIALTVILTALSQIGINTAPLLASASIIGVALGFGSQKLVQDFITGIFLLMENAMQVGDWVTVAGVSGTVEYLSIRTVRLRAGDGSLHIVPFSSVSTVNNTNRGIGNAAIRISVGYETDVERVIAELKAIGTSLREDPAFKDLILNDIEVWGVDSVDGSMVTLAGQMRCVDKGRWGVQREINRRILERFRELGIEIANPRASLLVPTEAIAPHRESPA